MPIELESGPDSPPADPSPLSAPRPIGWTFTLGWDGVVNRAPSPYLNRTPNYPQVMFAAAGNHNRGERKDAARDAKATGEFVAGPAKVRSFQP